MNWTTLTIEFQTGELTSVDSLLHIIDEDEDCIHFKNHAQIGDVYENANGCHKNRIHILFYRFGIEKQIQTLQNNSHKTVRSVYQLFGIEWLSIRDKS